LLANVLRNFKSVCKNQEDIINVDQREISSSQKDLQFVQLFMGLQ